MREVKGTVTSDEGPIPGVNVVIKGTTIGTTTDLNGKFKINVNKSTNVLVFSVLGFKTKEVDVTDKSEVDVKMEKDVFNLDQFVVTALGVRRDKRSVGYSTQEVTGKELQGTGEVNFIESLSSKVSGVQVTGSGGTPGASSKILIRGSHTFTGSNQPLVVIDGVPMDNNTYNMNSSGPPGSSGGAGDNPFNANLDGVNQSNRGIDINPNDIESITVLKGPSAAALYGVRAGNGVIVITTKKGTKGGFSGNFNTSFQVDLVNKLPDMQNRYVQGLGGGDYDLDSLGNVIGVIEEGAFLDGQTPNSWGSLATTEGITPVDNVGRFFRPGYTINNNLSVSGGTENSSFRLSLGQTKQIGVIPNSNMDRYNVRLTGETRYKDKLVVSGMINYVRTNGQRVQNGSNLSGIMLTLLRAPISFDLAGTGPDGYLDPVTGAQRQYFPIYDNPYWTVYKNSYTDATDRVMTNAYVKWTPTNYLEFSYRLGGDFYNTAAKQIFAIGSWQPANSPNGEISQMNQHYAEIYGDFLATYRRRFKDKHEFSVTLGHNLNIRDRGEEYLRGRDLSVPGVYNMSNASNLYSSNFNETVKTTALFFDLNYEFNRMLYVQVTGRNEWASTFGRNKNNFFYPSASVSFVFSELWGESKAVPFAKVRYGFAMAGINPPPYQTATYYTTPIFTDGFTEGNGFPYLGQNGIGYDPTGSLGNPDLRPELSMSHEVGLDLRFLQGRLNLDVTYFNQTSSDILVLRPISPTSGFSYKWENTGKMNNQGIEIILTTTPVKTEKFSWDITFNGTWIKNEVLELAPNVKEIDIEPAFTGIASYAIVGQPYGVLYGNRWERDASGNLVLDGAGYPQIAATSGFIGNPMPDFQMGLRNSFSFYNFTITALMDFRFGGDIWAGTIARLYRYGALAETESRDALYTVTGVDGGGNAVTSQLSPYDYFTYVKGDFGPEENAVYDGSWVRLRELGISYNLKLKKGFLKSINFNFIARNVFLITSYPGVDPETSLTGAGSNVSGFDYFNNPNTRSFSLGASFDF